MIQRNAVKTPLGQKDRETPSGTDGDADVQTINYFFDKKNFDLHSTDDAGYTFFDLIYCNSCYAFCNNTARLEKEQKIKAHKNTGRHFIKPGHCLCFFYYCCFDPFQKWDWMEINYKENSIRHSGVLCKIFYDTAECGENSAGTKINGGLIFVTVWQRILLVRLRS